MDDSALVRELERRGDVCRDREGVLERQRPLLRTIGQRLALDQIHDEIVGADIVKRADVRVIQGRRWSTLADLPAKVVA